MRVANTNHERQSLRIYILTDQEGVAGVADSVNYASPGSRYYEQARRLLTLEVNAAVDGALAGGATDIFVLDGHGHGSIDLELLHPATVCLAGRPIFFPFEYDASFDALMFVGQHAKANTDGGHLSHTESMAQDDQILNRRSLGELGWYMQLAGYYGKPTILVTGDQAVCDEAHALVSEVVTVAVKRGIKRGPAHGLLEDENRRFNAGAVHHAPAKAREMIRAAATEAMRAIDRIPPFFIEPPYECVSILRPEEHGGEWRVAINRSDDFVELGLQPRDHSLGEADIPFSPVQVM